MSGPGSGEFGVPQSGPRGSGGYPSQVLEEGGDTPDRPSRGEGRVGSGYPSQVIGQGQPTLPSTSPKQDTPQKNTPRTVRLLRSHRRTFLVFVCVCVCVQLSAECLCKVICYHKLCGP